MNIDEREKIVSFAIQKITNLIDPETGKIKRMRFKMDLMAGSLGLDTKQTLFDLSDKQLKEFINAALNDADCWELLIDYIRDDWFAETALPHLIDSFCIDYTLGLVQKPKKKKTSDARDFVFLFLAEVLTKKFKISFSRNDVTSTSDNFSALDAIAEACTKIENFSDSMQFSSLSRLRAKNKFITQIVDKSLKKHSHHTKRAAKNL